MSRDGSNFRKELKVSGVSTKCQNKLTTVYNKLEIYLEELNLFQSKPPTTNPHTLRIQRISTRVFVLLLSLSLSSLIVYISTNTINKTMTIKNPTNYQFDKLYEKYSQTLSCPCTKISINYQTFIRVTYLMHPLCHSMYVTDAWIKYIVDQTFPPTWTNDFRWLGPDLFQALRSMCDLAQDSISEGLTQFYATNFFTASAIPQHLLQSQYETLVEQFILSTTNNFVSSLRLVRDTTQSNAIQSAKLTNYNIQYSYQRGTTISVPHQYEPNCTCFISSKCKRKIPIYKNVSQTAIWFVPGFYLGCFILEGLRQSQLECFFNQSCLDELQSYIPSRSPIRAIALNSSEVIRFTSDTLIGDLIDSLMVQVWNRTLLYGKYFTSCQPNSCSYTVATTDDLVYIVTTLFGLIGGLVTALKLMIYPIVSFLMKRMCRRSQSTTSKDPLMQRLLLIFRVSTQYLHNLNLFPSIPSSNDPFILRTQRIATRIYLFLFSLCISVLLLYTSATTTIKTVDIQTPNLSEYKALYRRYPQTLSCPCSRISTSYKTFINITYSFHPICRSVFVTEEWIKAISNSNPVNYRCNDFRWLGPNILQALKGHCDLANQTLSDGLSQFYSNEYVSAFTTPVVQLESQSETLVNQFILSTTNKFLFFLQLIRDTTQVNGLLSALWTNYGLWYDVRDNFTTIYRYTYESRCSCAFSSQCVKKLAIQEYTSTIPSWYVPDLYIGCFVLEGLLQSRLTCFFNRTCLAELQSYVGFQSSVDDIVLDPLKSVFFGPDTMFVYILSLSMVEKWNRALMYENYYASCQPTVCTYTISTTHDLIYIVTTLFGLIGGLVTALKLIVPRATSMVMRRLYRRPGSLATNVQTHITITGISRKLSQYLMNFNLFPSIPPSNDQFILRVQRISTRAYLLLITLSISILLVYTCATTTLKTIDVQNPNVTTYEKLHRQYPETLICPCTKISTNYQTFINITYLFHQICYSDFVTEVWNAYLADANHGSVAVLDFRALGSPIFQAFRSFCQLVNKTITNGLIQFYSNEYVNRFITPADQLELQSEIFVDQFITSTTNRFLSSFRLVRDTSQSNALLSALGTNYFVYLNYYPENTRVVPQILDDNCNCRASFSCTQRVKIYPTATIPSTWMVPGFYAGCFLLEGLRKSQLHCLFNRTCLDEMIYRLQSLSYSNATTLDATKSIRFYPSTTVGDILDKMMVEAWNFSFIFSKYFESCNPQQCSYTITAGNDPIYIVTTLISLVGGIMTTLKFIIPRMTRLAVHCLRRRNRIAAAPTITSSVRYQDIQRFYPDSRQPL